MNVDVTVKSFDDNMQQYDFLIPSIKGTMETVIYQLAQLREPFIDITGINTVHFVDNYRNELFDFQHSVGHHSFATLNKMKFRNSVVQSTLSGLNTMTSKLLQNPIPFVQCKLFRELCLQRA